MPCIKYTQNMKVLSVCPFLCRIVFFITKIIQRISTALCRRKSHGSSVGIALGYGLDDQGYSTRFPAGAGNFSLHHRVQNGSGSTQPPIQLVPGALSLGVKRPVPEADH
jgi:hypothetical protein